MTSLYCILAREADTGVIFRRGPSKHTRLIKWNLKNDTFEPGQWLKGQIYARKSDLSPNGTKLVYFAAKFKRPLGTWIAISTPPFFRAHVLWPAIGTWNDLSLFETDSLLALATYRSDSSLDPAPTFVVPSQLRVKHKPWPGYFHRLPDHDRLIRDGWSVREGDPLYRPDTTPQRLTYRKTVSAAAPSSCLEMSVLYDDKALYALNDGHGENVQLSADWADIRSNDVMFSQGGKLLRMIGATSGRSVKFGPATELADFTDMKFESIEAPASATVW